MPLLGPYGMSVQGIQSKEYMPDLSLVGSHVAVLQPLSFKYQPPQSQFGSVSVNRRHAVLPDICKTITSPEYIITDGTLTQRSSTQSMVGSTQMLPDGMCSVIHDAKSRVDTVHSEPKFCHGEEGVHKHAEPVCEPQCWKSTRPSPDNLLLKNELQLEKFNNDHQMPHHMIQSVGSHRLPLHNVDLNSDGHIEQRQICHGELPQDGNGQISPEEENDQNGDELADEYNNINQKLPAKNKPWKLKRKKKSHKVHSNKTNWTKVRSKSAGRPWQPLSVKVSVTEHSQDDNFGPLIMAQCKSITVLPSAIRVGKAKVTAVVSSQVNPQTTPRSHRLAMGTMTSMSANGTSSFHLGQGRVSMPKSVESLLPHTMKSNMPAVEQVHRMVKVFCSDKHSGVLKELGMEVPCAPPATPTPDMLNRYEYIPSLNDIRSQRAVRIRLETLEKLERKRQEKLKGERSRREKQEVKEKEKELKKRQRLEIYALNKVMTEFENANFLEFCKKNGLNV